MAGPRWMGGTMGAVAGPLLNSGWLLAWLCLAAQVPAWLLLLFLQLTPATLLVFVFMHMAFVAMLSDFGARLQQDSEAELRDSLGRGVAGGAFLTVPVAILLLMAYELDFDLMRDFAPFALLWLAAAATALPVLLTSWMRDAPVRLWPIWQRLPIALVLSAPLFLLPPVPPLPEGECCGLFEGGLFVLPVFTVWMGLYLFGASVLLALVSAASIRPEISA